MDNFVARQPIFDLYENVYAYELLFRSSSSATAFTIADSDTATASVLSDAFLLFGIDKLTTGRPAFVNFTRKDLQQLLTTLPPKQSIVIEILENIEPDTELLRICRHLKEYGYVIALDDFVFDDRYRPLIELADIIKIDFLSTPIPERLSITKRITHSKVKFLAEKVETRAEFEQARSWGYSYFQGYFFSKPETFSEKNLSSFNLHYLKIFHEVRRPDIGLSRLEELIKGDIALSYKLLKYINSVYFSLRQTISSIRQALILLGPKQIERWVALLILRDVIKSRPEEVMILSVMRAKFAESLAQEIKQPELSAQAFMMGMFSLMEYLLNRPLASILQELPIHGDIKQALQGADNCLGNILTLIIAYEQGDWQTVSRYAQIYFIPAKVLSNLYVKALEWSENYCRAIEM